MLQKLQQLKKKDEGFTIVEVVIVLAIAGLIILIVFLAIPALQRNSRNTTQKDDVSKMIGAAQEISNNANGRVLLPADSGAIQTAANLSGAKTVSVVTGETSSVVPASADVLQLVTGATCVTPSPTAVTGPLSGTGAITAAGIQTLTSPSSSRSVAAIFVIEIAGGNYQAQCQGA